jgi:hypothetical protein
MTIWLKLGILALLRCSIVIVAFLLACSRKCGTQVPVVVVACEPEAIHS